MKGEQSQQLRISYRRVETLKNSKQNCRKHSPHQIRQISKSIQRFGFLVPALIDEANTLIAGHARVAAAKALGMEQIPTISIEGLTSADIVAFIIADNKLCENSQWDRAKLAVQLQDLIAIDPEFDLTVMGFEIPEIDSIMLEGAQQADPADHFDVDSKVQTSKIGDLWLMGRHRLLCGNSLDTESYDVLLEGRKAAAILTDPPFNVKIDGHATGNGSIHHRAFSMASGEMSEAQFIAFLSTIFSHLKRHSETGSLHYVFMDWRHLGELLSAGGQVYDDFINLCVWVKNNGGMGSFYRSRHELVLVFRAGKSQHQNNVQLGRYGRNRSNVWEYPCINSLSRNGEEGNLLALHPTVKPTQLLVDAILDCTGRGDLILDPFLGSGSTLVAAERVGRICCAMEIDPLYVDTAIRRWQSLTGDRAVHSVSGRAFDELCSEGENVRKR